MQHSSIEQIDRAAVVLLQALGEHREDLARYFEPGHLEGLEADLTTLRQALLGQQMGALYWDVPNGDVEHGVPKDTGSEVRSAAGTQDMEDSGAGP